MGERKTRLFSVYHDHETGLPYIDDINESKPHLKKMPGLMQTLGSILADLQRKSTLFMIRDTTERYLKEGGRPDIEVVTH